MAGDARPRLAVFKLASCDGCQLQMLNLEDELLDIAGEVEICYFLEARSQILDGPYDVALVEGASNPPQLANADHYRRLRQRWRNPGAAQHAGRG